MSKQHAEILLSLLAALALSACDSASEGPRDTPQTKFPGQVSAGGGTGGEVMARNGTLQAKADAQASPVMASPQAVKPANEAAAGTGSAAGTGAEKPSGTPGIPGGSEGNVSGTEMGGTTPSAAGTEKQDAPKPPASSEASSKEAQAKAQAEKEKQQLAASMDAVAQRWQSLASARGWQLETGADTGSSGVSALGETQTSAIGLPTLIRSEKLGTAPPSEDVKDPAQDPSN